MPRRNPAENLRIYTPENLFGQGFRVKWALVKFYDENTETEHLRPEPNETYTLVPESQTRLHPRMKAWAIIPPESQVFGHDLDTQKRFSFITKEKWFVYRQVLPETDPDPKAS